MHFSRLTLAGWRQFEFVDLELHPVITIVTGANGAGKSSLLNIFSRHLGWNRNYLGTPRRNEKGVYEFLSGLFESIKRPISWMRPGHAKIGSLVYSEGSVAEIIIPESSGIQYDIGLQNQKQVLGIHFGSH
jgi:energy-coupling factor transporter ATP-binding protein EcfA2